MEVGISCLTFLFALELSTFTFVLQRPVLQLSWMLPRTNERTLPLASKVVVTTSLPQAIHPTNTPHSVIGSPHDHQHKRACSSRHPIRRQQSTRISSTCTLILLSPSRKSELVKKYLHACNGFKQSRFWVDGAERPWSPFDREQPDGALSDIDKAVINVASSWGRADGKDVISRLKAMETSSWMLRPHALLRDPGLSGIESHFLKGLKTIATHVKDAKGDPAMWRDTLPYLHQAAEERRNAPGRGGSKNSDFQSGDPSRAMILMTSGPSASYHSDSPTKSTSALRPNARSTNSQIDLSESPANSPSKRRTLDEIGESDGSEACDPSRREMKQSPEMERDMARKRQRRVKTNLKEETGGTAAGEDTAETPLCMKPRKAPEEVPHSLLGKARL